MELRRYKDILAIQAEPDERPLGFHAHNMELAELSEEIWASLKNSETLQAHPELFSEIENWNNDRTPETTDALDSQNVKKLSLNVVQICNLRCSYCAAAGDGTYGSNTKKLDLDTAFKQIQFFLKQFRPEQHEKFHIQFLGGEPLLHPQVIRQLCQYAELCVAGVDIDVAFSVTTNGTLITPAVADMLAEFNFSVAVSLDGDAETNNIARPTVSKNQNSTELTVNGIRELIRVKKDLRALKVNSVFGAHNLNIMKAYKFLLSLYADWTEINFLYANNERDQDAVHTQEYIEQMTAVAAEAYRSNGLTGLAQIKQFHMVLSRLAAQTRIHSYCGAGKSFLQADTKGDLYACNWFMNDTSEKIGKGIEIDETLKAAYAPSLIELNNCQTCWARHFCGGGCLFVHKSKTGHRHSKDPEFCKRTRSLGATAIYYFGLKQTELNN